MRDKIKDKKYFEAYLNNKTKYILSNEKDILLGKINNDFINNVLYDIFRDKVFSLVAKYSLGTPMKDLQKNTIEISNKISDEWLPNKGKVSFSKKAFGEVLYSDQYIVWYYERMLNVVSLAYLLEIPDKNFKKIISVIDRDKISDNLLEFIIKARFPDRVQKRKEIYDKEQSVILKVYDKLRKATKQTDKKEVSKLVKQFLDKDFYHRHLELYNSHKNDYKSYCGYWSFEAAAIVKIMGLDDSSFINHKYYPKDMVHQEKENSKKGFFQRIGF